nr:hypothetical protein CFP56_78157 [Quercus suber]
MRQALVPYTLAVYTAFDALQLAAAHSLESHASIITTITTTTSTTSTITVYADQSTERPTSKTSSSSASSLPIAAFAAPSMAYTASLDDAVLNSTNLYRANYGADALTWNATLAAFAQTHAEKCIWQHSVGLPSPLPQLSLPRGNYRKKLICRVFKGRTVRREPRGRLRDARGLDRRVGARRARVRLVASALLRAHRTFHAVGVAGHDASRVRGGAVRWRGGGCCQGLVSGVRVQSRGERGRGVCGRGDAGGEER